MGQMISSNCLTRASICKEKENRGDYLPAVFFSHSVEEIFRIYVLRTDLSGE